MNNYDWDVLDGIEERCMGNEETGCCKKSSTLNPGEEVTICYETSDGYKGAKTGFDLIEAVEIGEELYETADVDYVAVYRGEELIQEWRW